MSLDDTTLDLIRTTLPVVGGAIDRITPNFYRRMFTSPELERDLFNRGNQKQGEQQKALAGAIAGYARLITGDDPGQARPILSRIAHKHASPGITADQYAIVHRHLFDAIGEVLADELTAEIVPAWDALYWQMADELIEVEHALYAAAGLTPGEVWRDLVVRPRTQESADTVSFELAAVGGSALPTYRPGQYVSVQVPVADGAQQIRQYSLVGVPGADTWQISVKVVPAAQLADGSETAPGEVSDHLNRELFEGDTVRVSHPFGDLVLEDGDGPVLLVSAGIGCPPIIGMLHHLAATGTDRPVSVLHADRSPADHAHRAELRDLVARLPRAQMHRWYEDLGTRSAAQVYRGRADLSRIEIPVESTVYLYGPQPFVADVRRGLIASVSCLSSSSVPGPCLSPPRRVRRLLSSSRPASRPKASTAVAPHTRPWPPAHRRKVAFRSVHSGYPRSARTLVSRPGRSRRNDRRQGSSRTAGGTRVRHPRGGRRLRDDRSGSPTHARDGSDLARGARRPARRRPVR